MRLIDKYILKKFLTTFFFVVLIINAVVCVIDYGEKSDDFIQKNVSAKSIIFDYYVNMLLHLTNMLSPITVFIATVFITARLAARTEIVAILAGGVSFRRMLVPYLVGSTMLAAVTFVLNGWVIPAANKTKVAFEIAYLKSPFFFDERNIHFKVAPNTFVYMQSYNNVANVGYLFTMEKVVGNQLLEKLSSDRIAWDSVKRIWHIDNYRLHKLNGDVETILSGTTMDTTLNLSPKDFESKHLLHETFTIPQLDEYIAKQRARGNTSLGVFLVEKYERYTYPFAIIILTIMGVIVSARKSRQGTGMQIAFGFLLAFAFITFVRMSRSMGQAGSLEPIVAAWIPTLIFALIAVVMYRTVPR